MQFAALTKSLCHLNNWIIKSKEPAFVTDFFLDIAQHLIYS